MTISIIITIIIRKINTITLSPPSLPSSEIINITHIHKLSHNLYSSTPGRPLHQGKLSFMAWSSSTLCRAAAAAAVVACMMQCSTRWVLQASQLRDQRHNSLTVSHHRPGRPEQRATERRYRETPCHYRQGGATGSQVAWWWVRLNGEAHFTIFLNAPSFFCKRCILLGFYYYFSPLKIVTVWGYSFFLIFLFGRETAVKSLFFCSLFSGWEWGSGCASPATERGQLD